MNESRHLLLQSQKMETPKREIYSKLALNTPKRRQLASL